MEARQRPATRSRTLQAQVQVPSEKGQEQKFKAKADAAAAAPKATAMQAPARSKVPTSVAKMGIQKEVTRINKTPSFTETFIGRLEWKGRHYDKPVTSTPTKSLIPKHVTRGSLGKDTVISPIPKPTHAVNIGLELEKLKSRPRTSIQVAEPTKKTSSSSEQPAQVAPGPVTPAQTGKTNYKQIPQPAKAPCPATPEQIGKTNNKQMSRAPLTPLQTEHMRDNTTIMDGNPANFTTLLVRYGEHDDAEHEDEENIVFDHNKITKTYTVHKSGNSAIATEVKRPKAVKFSTPATKRRVTKRAKTPVKPTKSAPAAKTANKDKPKKEKIDPALLNWQEEMNKEFDDVMNTPLCVQNLD